MEKKNITVNTIARLVVLMLLLANQTLVMCGMQAIPFIEEDVYAATSLIALVMSSLWSAWKNNSISQPALAADEYLAELRGGK